MEAAKAQNWAVEPKGKKLPFLEGISDIDIVFKTGSISIIWHVAHEHTRSV
jgi:hypothetical protein